MALDSGTEYSSLEEILAQRFHITTGFHEGQREIIEHLSQNKRVLAIQRTGWGKSLCYQLASLLHPHLTIVFSPLKALMRDQCMRCNNLYNIPSAIVSSDFSEEENELTLRNVVDGNIKILFIAPERLNNPIWQKYIVQISISMIVIDEAHCISMWGHDFRPDYRRIQILLQALPSYTPVLALTATANHRVEEDILAQIGHNAKVIRGIMQRPNLLLSVIPLHGDAEKLSYLATLSPQLQGTGIIYTATRYATEMITAFLQSQGIDALHYHAGCDDDVRQEIEQNLQNSEHKVFCSTNALGMGIDKKDVRFVIHYHFPASPIHYYQEIGRAGRDGYEANCILLYDEEDRKIQEYFLYSAKPESRYYHNILNTIQNSSQGLKQKELLLQERISTNNLKQILTDLQEQGFIAKDQTLRYRAIKYFGQPDFTFYDEIQQQKLKELYAMLNYAQLDNCYTHYLTTYLGDTPRSSCQSCANCDSQPFPTIAVAKTSQQSAQQFLEKDYLPHIESKGKVGKKHEEGWSLSFHGKTHIGALVRRSKYENGGPFPEELVRRAVEIIRERYPINCIDFITSIPPTKSGDLVESFAQRIANMVSITYVPMLVKKRETAEQKNFVNKTQKEMNVKDAFTVSSQHLIVDCTILLIDDIYDSGYTMRAATEALRQVGAIAVYPFTITRTLSDDQ